jgi:hypothetical protein
MVALRSAPFSADYITNIAGFEFPTGTRRRKPHNARSIRRPGRRTPAQSAHLDRAAMLRLELDDIETRKPLNQPYDLNTFEALIRGLVDAREWREAAARGGSS